MPVQTYLQRPPQVDAIFFENTPQSAQEVADFIQERTGRTVTIRLHSSGRYLIQDPDREPFPASAIPTDHWLVFDPTGHYQVLTEEELHRDYYPAAAQAQEKTEIHNHFNNSPADPAQRFAGFLEKLASEIRTVS